ncbi:Rgg family transcriptional regulator [Paenibacillus terrigena]|uniref:helix-turn-helix domain-containing protein n=1 Tax=Paenibacillus terrigena TaxID=369333 RepID=UPI0028D00497|nr:Rgg family transcriptional regulator [Paenibacillus terrigena]
MAYGETIRNIRIAKGLSQKKVYEDIISKSYAIAFEQGAHDISLRIFIQILDRLMIDIDEFFYIYVGYQPSQHDEFLDRYATAGNRNDLKSLQALYVELLDGTDHTSKINQAEVRSRIRLLKSFECEKVLNKSVILEEDIHTITEHLANIQTWTLREILLFANTLDYFDYEQQEVFFQTLMKSMSKYKNYDRGKNTFSVLLNNIIYELIRGHRFMAADKLLEDLEELNKDITGVFFRIMYNYYKGIIRMKLGQEDEGLKQAQSAIRILCELDFTHQAELLQATLTQILEDI